MTRNIADCQMPTGAFLDTNRHLAIPFNVVAEMRGFVG